MKQVMRWNK